MKKLISLLMTLAMLTGTCVAFAEAEAVDHQAALEALLEDAGVELQPGDLSRPFEKALGNTVMQLVLTHTMLTEEQMTEWEAAGAAAHKALEELETKDAKQSTTILNDAIDGIESISPFVKSMLKRVVFNGLYLRSEVTETERQVIRAIYNALEAELHGADEARTGEILAGVKEAMEGLVGLHNVRDDMMFILKFLQEKGDVSTGVMDDERLVHIAGEILTAADQVMGDRIEELDAALAEISAIDEETVGWSVQLSEEMGKGLKMLDPEELAEVESHIRELANAVLQADQDARNEQIKHVWDDHIAKKLDQRNYDVLLGMEDEEILTLARNLLRVAYNWQNGLLDDALRDEQKALMQNEGDLSEEEVATLKDSVAKKIETMGVPEEHKERAVDNLFNDLIVVSRFSEEEKVLANRFLNCLYRKLEEKLLDTAQLAELENEMETLLYELGGDSERYQVNLEDLAAVLEGVDLEKAESLEGTAKFLLTIRFMEHLEMYSVLSEEARAKLPEVDKALFEAVNGLEINGRETTMEQLQALEVAVVDVLTQLDCPAEVLAMEVSKTVSNCLLMSTLTAEEQEIVESALEAISQTLTEGNREEIRVLKNYRHQVLHYAGEGLVKLPMQGGQA